MDSEDKKLLQDTYRLAHENNKMLRAMRRASWIRLIIWIVFYAALIIGPIWFYQKYLSSYVQNVFDTYNKLQQTGAGAEQRYQDFQNSLQNLKNRVQNMTGATSSASQ